MVSTRHQLTRYILAKTQRASLVGFALSNVMLAFDYDGTLAPIVEEPGRAHMRAKTRRLLARAARSYPCVVISGRALSDIETRLHGVPVWDVSGSHGVEPWGQTTTYARRVGGWVAHLDCALTNVAGVWVENKQYCVTVHYRQSPNQRAAKAAIEKALAGIKGARILGGQQAVNLIPRGAPHKGVALERVRRLLACDTAVYIGDDETDEDAFGAAPCSRLLSIRVGPTGRTRATHHLKHQGEIDALLASLVALRQRRRH